MVGHIAARGQPEVAMALVEDRFSFEVSESVNTEPLCANDGTVGSDVRFVLVGVSALSLVIVREQSAYASFALLLHHILTRYVRGISISWNNLDMTDTNIVGVADEGTMVSLLLDGRETVGSFVEMIHRARAHRGGDMATAWQWDE